ncbi:MAG: alpha/beta fold hydrolase, partial [Candidatus Zixiibacteriota bacterium]
MRNSRFLFYAAGLFNLLLLCLTLLSCGKKDQQQVTVPAVFVDSVLSPDSVEIYYQVEGTGDGPALVFVHGWSCDRSYWRNQIDAFKTDFKTVAIDLAGHGASGLNRREWTMPAYGADVAAVVNQLELKKIILIGHSMGGAVIIEAARLLPEQTIALIGVDTYQDMGGKYSEEEAKVFIAPFEADFKT